MGTPKQTHVWDFTDQIHCMCEFGTLADLSSFTCATVTASAHTAHTTTCRSSLFSPPHKYLSELPLVLNCCGTIARTRSIGLPPLFTSIPLCNFRCSVTACIFSAVLFAIFFFKYFPLFSVSGLFFSVLSSYGTVPSPGWSLITLIADIVLRSSTLMSSLLLFQIKKITCV